MTAYFAPSGSPLNITWNGASSYTAPSGIDVGFDFTAFAYPKVIGDIDLAFSAEAEMSYTPAPEFIVGNIDLEFGPQSWMYQYQPMGIDNVLFEFSGLTASIVIGEPEQFDLDDFLPGFDSDIFIAESFGLEAIMPRLYGEAVLTPAGLVNVESSFPGLMLDFVTVAHGDAAFSGYLSGLRLDASIHSANAFDFECVLNPMGGVDIALADDCAINAQIPALLMDLAFNTHIELDGVLSGVSSDFQITASEEVQLSATLPTLASQFEITHYEASFAGVFPGLTHELVVVRHGDIAIYDVPLRLTGDWQILQVIDVNINGVLSGLTAVFDIDNGVIHGDISFNSRLPSLKGERIFDTVDKACQTRYL